MSENPDPYAICDRQDIVREGITQAIGVVAVLNVHGTLLAISENHSCHAWVRKEVTRTDIEVITFHEIFHEDIVAAIEEGIEYCRDKQPPKGRTQVCDIFFARKTYVTLLLQLNGTLVVEIEDFNREKLAVNPIVDTANVIGKLVTNTTQETTVNNLCKCLFEKCSYDRAMTYKFLDDGCGEVIYEMKNDDMVKSSFLGLRFPAGDIPAPARKAYVENPVRFIADVEQPSSKLIQRSKDVVLTQSFLRGCVPVHKNYLKNMGVVSSLSIAIVSMEGSLWGLIALHSYTSSKIPTIEDRVSFKILSSVTSNHVQHIDYAERVQREADVEELLSMITTDVSLGVLLLTHERKFLKAFDVTSVSLFKNVGPPTIIGKGAATLEEIAPTFDPISYGTLCNPPRSYACLKLHESTLVFTRMSTYKEVSWAGNPKGAKKISADVVMPRKSFAKYIDHQSENPPVFTDRDKSLLSKTWSVFKTHFHQERVEQIERKIAETTRENDLMEMKSEEDYAFFANMSHELRTPLHAISGIFDIIYELRNDDDLASSVKTYTKIGMETCQHMLGTLNDILSIVRKTHEEKGVALSVVITKDIFLSTSTGLEILAAKNNIRFQLVFAEDCNSLVRANVEKITKIFNNICGNAIKFTDRNGRVDVSIGTCKSFEQVKKKWQSDCRRYDGHHCETHSDLSEGSPIKTGLQLWLVFTVEDNGCGIARNELRVIFQKFRQLGDVKKKKFSSTGLGLYITQSDVKSMGGFVAVASTLSKGTFFSCALPVEVVDASAMSLDKTSRGETLDGEMIEKFKSKPLVFLVVDDSKVNLMIAKKQIEKAFVKATLLQASNGALAVEKVNSVLGEGGRIDGVFMDCHMPVMSGFEATHGIKCIDKSIPVAMLTADITETSRQAMLSAGADFILIKPSRPHEIVDMCIKMVQMKENKVS